MSYKSFKLPKGITLKDRTSSITNAKINGIIPCIQPTEEEIKEALKCLEQDPNAETLCVYCGNKSTEWDHLNPLIKNKKHTGFITEINNLVPSCSTCNSSKGNSNWKDWLLYSKGEKTPRARGVSESSIQHSITIIEKYQKTHKPLRIDLEKIVGPTQWKEYEDSMKNVFDAIEKAQNAANKFKEKTQNAVSIYMDTEKNLRSVGKEFFKDCYEIILKYQDLPIDKIESEIKKTKFFNYSPKTWETKIRVTLRIIRKNRLEIALELCKK